MNHHDPNLAKVELVAEVAALLATLHFDNYLPGLLAQDETLAQRVTTASTRLQSIAALALP